MREMNWNEPPYNRLVEYFAEIDIHVIDENGNHREWEDVIDEYEEVIHKLYEKKGVAE